MHEGWGVQVVCDAKVTSGVANCGHHEYLISSRGSFFVRCSVVVQYEGCAVLYSLTNRTQDMYQIAGTRVYISLLPAYTSILFCSRLHLHSFLFLYWTHRQHQLAAMAPKGSRKGRGKATARAKMPTSVINRRLWLDQDCMKGFISEHICGLIQIYNLCGVKDERA